MARKQQQSGTTNNSSDESASKRGKLLANVVVDPNFQAAATLRAFNKDFGEMSLTALADALQQQTAILERGGDKALSKGLLLAQARVLDGIFNHLARMALQSKLLPHLDHIMRLALRSQHQSQATLRTLADLQPRIKALALEVADIEGFSDPIFQCEPPGRNGKQAKRTNGSI